MTRTLLEKRLRMVPTNDDLVVVETDGLISIMQGASCIAANDVADMAKAARWAIQIPTAAKVLMLGLGTGNLLHLLRDVSHVTVIERELPIINWFKERWPLKGVTYVCGDYRDILRTQSGDYDVIVDDTGEETGYDFSPHLAPLGKLLTWREVG